MLQESTKLLYKANKFKEMYEIGISRGVGGLRKNPFGEGGMDILWNYTIQYKLMFHQFGFVS